MKSSEIAGVVRAVLPAVVAYAAGRGVDLAWLDNPEIVAGAAAVLAAVFSVRAKRKGKTS